MEWEFQLEQCLVVGCGPMVVWFNILLSSVFFFIKAGLQIDLA